MLPSYPLMIPAPSVFPRNFFQQQEPHALLQTLPCSSDNDDDVWFQFTCPANGVYIYVEKGALISSSASANMGMEIVDASSGLSVDCVSSPVVGSSTLFSGAAGVVYRIRLWTVGTTDRAVFSICLQNGFGVIPTNDTCAAATLLTVGAGACTNPVTGNLFNSNITPSRTTNPTCTVNTTLKNDVWYKAIVPASGNLVVADFCYQFRRLMTS